jgi:DivIVA domain-containing protein
MPLTPEDVSNKRFTPVRLREGYDMGEVDQFLDEVEAELSRLTRENDELRARLGASQDGVGTAPATAVPATTSGSTATADAPVATDTTEEAPAAPVETLKVTTVADASSAAVRLLEIATRNASELVGEAQEEAGRIVGEARTNAEKLTTQSKELADRLEADSRNRAQMLDSETAQRRERLFGDLEKEKAQLNAEVDNLRTFEREYRARLKTYFEQQLAALDGAGEAGSLDEAGRGGPRSRLKSLLGDDGDQQA